MKRHCTVWPAVAAAMTTVGALAAPVRIISAGIGLPYGDSAGYTPSISRDGRYVAFASYASNLVPGDTNNAVDAFVHDRVLGTTVRVSVDSSGRQVAAGGQHPCISPGGDFVFFDSSSPDLVPGDGNVHSDVFGHNLDTGATFLVSRTSTGKGGNGASQYPSTSVGGLYTAFQSVASDLVADDRNHVSDVFVYSQITRQVTRVSRTVTAEGNGPSQEASISIGGNRVAFSSAASNLVASDTNGQMDVFLCDVPGGTVERVSVASDGSQLAGISDAPSSAENGHVFAFRTTARAAGSDTNSARDVYLRDRIAHRTTPVSVGMGGLMVGGDQGRVSPCGSYVLWTSGATNVVPGDTNGYPDVFLYTVSTGAVTRVPVTRAGVQADLGSSDAVASLDARFVAFVSRSANILPGVSNGQQVYLSGPSVAPDLPAFIRSWRAHSGPPFPEGIDQNGDLALDRIDASSILRDYLLSTAGL